jgi:hypothetical protein
VLPEDDANRAMANGFYLRIDAPRQMALLRPAGGWHKVLECFKSDHIAEMEVQSNRFMVLLLDFDCSADRLEDAKAAIPDHLADRVFILGVWSEPEDLKKDLGTFEKIGMQMADDCLEDTDKTWGHYLLLHNSSELERLRERVSSILFDTVKANVTLVRR